MGDDEKIAGVDEDSEPVVVDCDDCDVGVSTLFMVNVDGAEAVEVGGGTGGIEICCGRGIPCRLFELEL